MIIWSSGFRIATSVAVAALWSACGGGGGGGGGCPRDGCPPGQSCIDNRCVPTAADADADIPDEGVDVPPDVDEADVPEPVRSALTVPGAAIGGFDGVYRYQFSLGAPQPMGSGRGDAGTWTFGPGAVHRR
ncbi:MAG: hypothetical protein QME96_12470 [Myxococcota bacterium]|nr:hypothetical protein [Myxococcota bacterium]